MAAGQALGAERSQVARRILQALPRRHGDQVADLPSTAALEAALQQLERHMERAFRCCLLLSTGAMHHCGRSLFTHSQSFHCVKRSTLTDDRLVQTHWNCSHFV